MIFCRFFCCFCLCEDVRVNQDFVDRALNLYKSEPAHLTSIEEVNRWVEEATEGHITNFMSSLPPNVVLMLINAIHFKGWSAFQL